MVGVQSEMERGISGVLMALGRPHMITGSGFLDNGLVTSPEQLVIDDEAIRFLKRIRTPIEIDAESLAIDVVEGAISDQGDVITEQHTLDHLRAGALMDGGLDQWNPETRQADGSSRVDLFERAHESVEEILGTHHVEPFDHALENEIERIVSEAERDWR